MRHVILMMLAVTFLFGAVARAEDFGERKRPLKPHEYGNILLDNYSTKRGMAPVVFIHWTHRSRFTCRVCHVELFIAMKKGDTEINCQDIRNGAYCGACHNGTIAFGRMEKGPQGEEVKRCDSCHSSGKDVVFRNNFYTFKKTVIPDRFGNGIDWQKTEENRKINPKDYVDETAPKYEKMDIMDVEIGAKQRGVPEIIFSHKKHADWNGCEACHPDVFELQAGKTRYTMDNVFKGKYCGFCHGTVAFPNADCQRCHRSGGVY